MPLSGSKSLTPLRPLPAALLIFASPHGEPRVIALGWLGVVCAASPQLFLQVGVGSGSTELPGAGEPFAVILPGAELPPELRRGTPAPMADCAFRIECRCRFLESRFGQYRLGGEVVALSHGGVRQGLPAPFDFCRFSRLPPRPPAAGGEGVQRP